MWFEILPSFGIIVACVGMPTLGSYFVHKWILNNPYRRDLRTEYHRVTYLRDRRIADNPYDTKSLDSIEDE